MQSMIGHAQSCTSSSYKGKRALELMQVEYSCRKLFECVWAAPLMSWQTTQVRRHAHVLLAANTEDYAEAQPNTSQFCSWLLCGAYLDGPLRNDDIVLFWVPHGELVTHFIDAVDPSAVLPFRHRMLLQQLIDACTTSKLHFMPWQTIHLPKCCFVPYTSWTL